MDSLAQIKRKVAELLACYEAQMGKPAFSAEAGSYIVLEQIAEECCGLTVIEDANLKDNVQGVLNRNEGTITYATGLSAQRIAFIIAHEIGHFVLDHPARATNGGEADAIEDTADNLDDESQGTALTEQDGVFRAYNDRDRWELEANVFAAELLVPTVVLYKSLRAEQQWDVNRLGAYFGLSKGAVMNRLSAVMFSRPVEQNLDINSAARQPLPMDKRQEIAAFAPSPALIIAGPGAGKTRVLTERFLDFINKGVPPHRILALTFSNKAAAEMRERLCAVAESQAHEIRVFTFHSFGLQLLLEYSSNIGLKKDLKILSPADAFVLLRNHLENLPLGCFENLPSPTQNLAGLLNIVSRAKDEMRTPDDVRQLAENYQEKLLKQSEISPNESSEDIEARLAEAAFHLDFATFYGAYQEILRAQGYVDFGDLIVEAVRLFANPEVAADIRGDFDHILVDEFQDINFASGRLIRALDGGREIVWAVGDPRQSIYGFRGASRANVRKFGADYPSAKCPIELNINYRSFEEIVAAGQAVPFDKNAASPWEPIPSLIADRGWSPSPPAVTFATAPDLRTELAGVLRVVQEQRKHYEAHEIAVLCRNRNMARQISDLLEEHDIATTWCGQLEDRPAFKDLMGLLLLVADDPQGILRLARHKEHFFKETDLRLLLTTARRKGNSALAALYAGVQGEIVGLSSEGVSQANQLRDLIFRLRPLKNAWTVLAKYLFEEAQWPREFFMDTSPQKRRYLAAVGQLADIAREFSLKGALSGEADTAAFVDYVKTCLESGEFPCADTTDAIPNAVNVLTIHKSKGLEWPFVIVPNLNKNAGNGRTLMSSLPGLVQNDFAIDDDFDEMCVFYVAVTRARNGLFLSRAEKGTRNATKAIAPLQKFLDSLDSKMLKRVTLTETLVTKSQLNATGETWERPETITLRSLETYERCGQQFKYDYVYGLKSEDRGYIHFRRAIYPVLEWIAEQAAKGELVSKEEIQEKLNIKWQEFNFGDGQFGNFYRRHAEQIVISFTERMKKGVRIFLRQKRTVTLNGISIELTLDEVEEGNSSIIRVHHFGRPAKSHQDKRILALLPLLNTEAEIFLTYPALGRETVCAFRKTFSKNRQEKVVEHALSIGRGEFEINSGEHCSHCAYNLICPA